MKKLRYMMSIVVCMALVSCENEIDNWYSETFDYSGRFVVGGTCEEYNADDFSVSDGLEVQIYNTAANIANEIWIEGYVVQADEPFHFKGKFKITGTPEHFTSTDAVVVNAAYAGQQLIAPGVPFGNAGYAGYVPVPTASEERTWGVQWYARLTLVEGGIFPKAATTIGGNTADSVYLKLAMHYDPIEYVSTPDLEWKFDPTSVIAPTTVPDDDEAEHWILTGYRYTGYPEDM
ncbi:hypothetical protein SAMD00024442_3_103 [Candidatus Symbiothrix dinenymphae]|nr:hypothetical protein SAMD00024442_3_103 [Candidatus Symbiothrix dinenymphae]